MACFVVMVPGYATAGPFADDMAKCLVKSASEADRADLSRWIFLAIAAHPSVASMSQISAQQRDAINTKASQLFNRLLFESCKSETEDAVKNEGLQTIEYAFGILGQVATRGLFTDPHVSEAMQALQKGLDSEKVKHLQTLTPH